MTHRLAFATLGVLKEPRGHRAVQGFLDRIAGVYAAADGSVGFLSQDTWQPSRGRLVVPKCIPSEIPFSQLVIMFSQWTDVATMVAFAFSGAHVESLSRSSEWFQRGPWPASASWWIPVGQHPTWIEVAERLDHIHEHGSTHYAFDFRHPFDVEGLTASAPPRR